MDISVRLAANVADQLSPEWREFAENPKYRGLSHVVLRDDEPVAVGSFSHNLLHPEPRHFDYLLAEGAEPTYLTHLLEALVTVFSSAEEVKSVHVTLNQDDQQMVSWAQGAGFRAVNHTWLGVLMPGSIKPTASAEVRRLSDYDSPNVRRSLALLHSQIYRDQHKWNPPAPIVPEMAESLFLDEFELIPEYLWYSVDDRERPTGVISWRKTRAPQVLELGWFGVLNGIDESVHKALFETAMTVVGGRAVNLEVDEHQQLTRKYFSELPVHWHKEIVRYERRVLE